MKTARRSDSARVHSPDNVELNIDCDVCQAKTGYSCLDREGNPVLGRFHLGRLRALRAKAIVITKGGRGDGEVHAPRIHPAHVLAFVSALLLLACGGSPFTVERGSLAAGDDAMVPPSSDAIAEHPDAGGHPELEAAPAPAEAALEAPDGSDRDADAALALPDAPAVRDATPDAPIAPSSGLCCRSETTSGLLVYTPIPVGSPFHLNDYGCADAGPSVVAACPDGG